MYPPHQHQNSARNYPASQVAWIGLALVLTALVSSACQPAASPESPSSPSASSVSSSPSASSSPLASSPAATATNRYDNPSIGLGFTYPQDFVVDDAATTQPPESATALIELWQQERFEAIQAGEYEGGTEFPPNVQITVYDNPDRLSLQDWVARQNQQFTQPQDFQTRTIANQPALTFASTGLYEHENVVLQGRDETEVIGISLATVGVEAVDEPNRRAFDQVLSSLEISE